MSAYSTKPGADAQQLGFALATCTHFLKAALGVTAHGQHVVAAREYRHFTHAQFALVRFDDVQHREQAVAVVLDLRPLVAVARVFDRQRMQIELRLHLLERRRIRIAQRHPDEVFGLARHSDEFPTARCRRPGGRPGRQRADQHAIPSAEFLARC